MEGFPTRRLLGHRPDVLRARTDGRTRLVLLDGVTDPADRSPDREQRQRGSLGKLERMHQRDEREVDGWFLAEDFLAERGDLAGEGEVLRLRVVLLQQFEEELRARIAVAVERMAESLDRFAAAETRRDLCGQRERTMFDETASAVVTRKDVLRAICSALP